MQSFRIGKRTPVEICKANNRAEWFAFVTTRDNRFGEPISRSRSAFVFRRGPWLLRAKPHHVEMFNGIRWVRLK